QRTVPPRVPPAAADTPPPPPALPPGLTTLGAHAPIPPSATADPDQLPTLLSAVPDQHPLTAVIHTAGVLNDATLTSQTPHHLATVLHPKANTAWHLHHATRHHDLAAFVLYSSISATLGGPGQANYAAANTFLDALAQHRHHHGLPATSLTCGLRAEPTTMTGQLTDTDQVRISRTGVTAMPTEEALTLLDTALTITHPTLAPLRLNPTALRNQAHNGTLPPLLSTLTTTPKQ